MINLAGYVKAQYSLILRNVTLNSHWIDLTGCLSGDNDGPCAPNHLVHRRHWRPACGDGASWSSSRQSGRRLHADQFGVRRPHQDLLPRLRVRRGQWDWACSRPLLFCWCCHFSGRSESRESLGIRRQSEEKLWAKLRDLSCRQKRALFRR